MARRVGIGSLELGTGKSRHTQTTDTRTLIESGKLKAEEIARTALDANTNWAPKKKRNPNKPPYSSSTPSIWNWEPAFQTDQTHHSHAWHTIFMCSPVGGGASLSAFSTFVPISVFSFLRWRRLYGKHFQFHCQGALSRATLTDRWRVLRGGWMDGVMTAPQIDWGWLSMWILGT